MEKTKNQEKLLKDLAEVRETTDDMYVYDVLGQAIRFIKELLNERKPV